MPYKQLSVVILVAFMVTGITCTPVQTEKIGDPHLETNIVFLSPGEQYLQHSIDKDKQGNLIVDPRKFVDGVQQFTPPDVLEDPTDRFVTGRKGHVRLDYVDSEEKWAGEVPIGNQKRSLVRVKRCGGGGGGGDGGDTNRSRRARQRRAQAQNGNGNGNQNNNRNRNRNRSQRRRRQRQRQRQRRAESQTSTNQTTTKVIKVIEVPEGQTIQYQPSVQQHKVVQAVAPQSQKQVVHTVVPQQQPIVHTVVPQQQQQQQQQQPIVHTVVPRQQQQPIVQSAVPQQQPVLVQQQPAQQPAVVAQPPVATAAPQQPIAAAAAPSISVQGSVKINSA